MQDTIFDTPITETAGELSGPFRQPRQMLADQTYDGHMSLHDESEAQNLGFSGAPIEGPTHFSQFDPLLVALWGKEWLEHGCISAHFKNVVVEGEEVQAFVERPADDARIARIRAVKKTGELVLVGTASLGPDHPETELDRLLTSRAVPDQLVILENIRIGDQATNPAPVQMELDQHLGDNYPFTLRDKLAVITEPCPWYSEDSPWGRPIIPMEMISPLVQYQPGTISEKAKRPAVGMFADLEIRLLKGPLFVGQNYLLEREVVGLGESRRTESMWILTRVRAADSGELVATMLLNSALLKASYASYEEEAKSMGKVV